jgi:hypothetical protein
LIALPKQSLISLRRLTSTATTTAKPAHGITWTPPLADSRIDLARECASGDCLIAKTEHFLAVLKNPGADKDAKTQALKREIRF